MKRILAIILVCLTIFCLGLNTIAAMPETVVPMWSNIRTINNILHFNGTSGTANASVCGKTGTTKITGTLTVYGQGDRGWELVDSVSGTSTELYFFLDINFTGIVGGYYKSVLTITVTINGVSETETVTSYEACCPLSSNN